MKLPATLPIVVESDVLGSIAVSVPVVAEERGDATATLTVSLPAIEDAVAERETSYLDSHKAGDEDAVKIDKEALAKHATHAVLVGDVTWDEIGVTCGWTREDAEYNEGRRGDGQKVRELLGLASGKNARKRDLEYDEANALVKALGIDPVDVGL